MCFEWISYFTTAPRIWHEIQISVVRTQSIVRAIVGPLRVPDMINIRKWSSLWGSNITIMNKTHRRADNPEHIGTCNTPWKAYISKQKRRWMYFLGILTRNGQMALKVKVNYPHFQYQPRESWDAYLVQMWWILLKSIANYCTDKPNFLEFLVQTAKMTLKVMINDLHFQYQLKVSQDACLV